MNTNNLFGKKMLTRTRLKFNRQCERKFEHSFKHTLNRLAIFCVFISIMQNQITLEPTISLENLSDPFLRLVETS